MTSRYLPLRHWPHALLRVLLPSFCALCGGGCDDVVCAACREAYAQARTVRCGQCANPLTGTALATGEKPSLPRRREPRVAPPVTQANSDPRLRGDDVDSVRGDDVDRLRGDDVERMRGDDVDWGTNDAHPATLICGTCLRDPPAFDATVAAVDYAIPLDQLVLQLKFGARLALAPWFARQMRDAVLARPGLPLPDLLCPVPLGPDRLVERGFNQALEIARPLAAALGVACHPALALRTLDTLAQSGVAPDARARNVRGAFAVADPDLVEGRHVGLVDDVMTSGHTLGELAAAFKRFGAARVTNLVFARTPPHP
jgi:ComF family protein